METCKWKNQEEDGSDCCFDTECGEAQYFVDGNIEENDYTFCPYCGRVIEGEK